MPVNLQATYNQHFTRTEIYSCDVEMIFYMCKYEILLISVMPASKQAFNSVSTA